MKLLRIIYILFLLLYANVNASNNDENFKVNYIGAQIDSTYMNNQHILNVELAKSLIEKHKKALFNKVDLSKEDLKNIAVSYAYLGDAQNASEYLEKYIIVSHSINILNNSAFETINESKEFRSILKKYEPKFNGWILFFFSTGLIGIFIAIVLNLRKKGDTTANILISLFVLLHSFFTIHLSLFLSNYTFEFPHSLYITASFSFLYGPLLYFYFKRIANKYKFRFIDILHLIPSIALLIYFLPIYSLSAEEKLDILFSKYGTTHFIVIFVVIVKCISLVTYGYLVYKIYSEYKEDVKSKQHEEILRWKRNITVLNAIYILSYIVYGAAIVFKYSTTNILVYPQIFSMSVIVLYVGYTAYVQPRIFSKKYLFNNQLTLKYKKSGMTEGFSFDLKEQLLHLLNEEKVYKNNGISLDFLSQKLDTTRHNLSQVINEHFDVNFFNLINKYRIIEAQEIFKKDTNHNLNIIDVAYDVGFNNKVTFNRAFKEQTNVTPSEYLKSLKSQDIYSYKVNFR